MTEDDEAQAPRPGPPDERFPSAPERVSPAGEAPQYIDDRWTKVFVVAVLLVFALIFANAIFLGQGGLLTTTPSPTPTASPTVAPTASPSPSATASPSASATASVSPSATASASSSSTPAPTGTSVAPTAPPTTSPAP